MIGPLDRWVGTEFTEGGSAAARRRSLSLAVAATAFAGLMLELLLARLFPFLLGNISAFVAIPVAMFGLSLGALGLHWRSGEPDPRSLPGLLLALLVSVAASFAVAFALFNHVDGFGLTHHQLQNPARDALKTAVLSLVFVPPFALVGVALSTAFSTGRAEVGRLYSIDLAASALACLLTPLLLGALDLPVAICALLFVVAGATAALFSRAPRRALAAGAVLLLVVLALASQQRVFTERPDPGVMGTRYADGREVAELRHRWNSVSRVALLRFIEPEDDRRSWRLIHDDGISNVIVRPYLPRKIESPGRPRTTHDLPFQLDQPPKSALVMFAGAGHDMLRLYERARGDLRVTGVELNGLVKSLVSRGDYDEFDLAAFYERPNVDLVIDEGRAFLNRASERWDLVFVASNGAQHASRTGHSRKFLDTTEAMETYLDRLEPGGLIVFNQQPIRFKLEIWHRLLDARPDSAPFEDCVVVLGRSTTANDHTDTLLVKPDGFSASEVDAIRRTLEGRRTRVRYAPGQAGASHYAQIARRPASPEAFVPVDDRPYERRLEWRGLDVVPSAAHFRSTTYSLDWIKAFSLVFFTGLSALVVLLFYARARGGERLPLWLAGYFGLTGLCYMQAQIGLMAKLELFLGRPLYSIAVVLAAFLLANGAGSAWVQRRQDAGRRPGLVGPAVAAAAAVPLTLMIVDVLVSHLLGLPTWLKVPLALASAAPLAFVLGMFYPLGVSLAVDRGLGRLVPMTFGLATLSSVVGSTWAMVAVINLGFRLVVLQALAGYLLLALLIAVFGGRRPA